MDVYKMMSNISNIECNVIKNNITTDNAINNLRSIADSRNYVSKRIKQAMKKAGIMSESDAVMHYMCVVPYSSRHGVYVINCYNGKNQCRAITILDIIKVCENIKAIINHAYIHSLI